ncbi:MAG: hypothetical protein ACJAR2_003122 [Ilumatobacter sp.]|jgi:hypothetical protein
MWLFLIIVVVVLAVLVGLSLLRSIRGDSAAKIDPFGVSEPWRHFVLGAQRAGTKLHTTVDTADEGPLRNRMLAIVERSDTGLEETWRIAKRGDQIDETVRRLDPTALRLKHASLTTRRNATPTPDLVAAVTSVEKQLASADRLTAQSARTADTLRLAQTRLDEIVSRAAEVSIGAGDTDRYEHDVDDLVIELEALRQAVEETNRA